MAEDLAAYAVTGNNSRGRKFHEKSHPYRTDFERDRDRIIHCSAFRRLEGKTQVFMPGLDDFYRTRLTHSIEVAQIGRTIAKALKLNQNLTEAICLAHDLGHAPFGHAGEKTLNQLMKDYGGFEHNRQTLRIVDLLEQPYAEFAGLNLMYETRAGLARHKGPYDKPENNGFREKNCSLEGQVVDVSDRIAYNCHDLEDGLRAGLINTEELENIEIFKKTENQINALKIEDTMVRRTRIAKTIIDQLVSDCISWSRKKITREDIKRPQDVYHLKGNLISLSEKSQNQLSQLEEFLLRRFYKHKSLAETGRKVSGWLGELFEKLCRNHTLMPAYYQGLIDRQGLQRAVCDYIAGMTDGFCLKMLGGPPRKEKIVSKH